MSEDGDTKKEQPPGWLRRCNARALGIWRWLADRTLGLLWWCVCSLATGAMVALLMLLQPLLLVGGAALVLGIVFRTEETLALLALLPGYTWTVACFLWTNAGTLAAGVTAERAGLLLSHVAGAARLVWASILSEQK